MAFTDHQVLVGMLPSKSLKSKFVRQDFRLQKFEYTIHYGPGKFNAVADVLSRLTINASDYDTNTCFHTDCFHSD